MTTRIDRLRKDAHDAETHEDMAYAYRGLSEALESHVVELERLLTHERAWNNECSTYESRTLERLKKVVLVNESLKRQVDLLQARLNP